jgi:hypothetical protein
MPASERSNCAFARTFSSCRTPTVANTGAVVLELGAGLAVCATTQMEQEDDSVWLGWLWVDSAAAVHNMRDRQSHADHRPQKRIVRVLCIPASGLDSLEFIKVTSYHATCSTLL